MSEASVEFPKSNHIETGLTQSDPIEKNQVGQKIKSSTRIKQLLKSRIIKNHPVVLYHYITGRCDCHCPFCYYVTGTNQDLDLVTLLSVYEQARDLGFLATIITGGEPLVRPDLPVILQYIKALGMKITLMTNGNFLEDRWKEIKNLIDILIVSVDFPDDDLDSIRTSTGTFQKIVSALDHIKNQSGSQIPILINSVLWSKNGDQTEALAMFARDMGAEIIFYPMDATRQFRVGSVENRKRIALTNDAIQNTFREIKRLKNERFPIVNSDEYIDFFIRGKPAFRCHYQTMFTQIMANGDVIDCSQWETPLGNIAQLPLDQIVYSPKANRARKTSHTCNHCNRFDVIETSMAFSWHLDPIVNMLRFT